MKIGIVTMISDNYGNRLQNYALQEVLENLGNEVETLNNPWSDNYNPLISAVLSWGKRMTYRVVKKPERYLRTINFYHFNRKYIKFSKYWLNNATAIRKAVSEYDLFICGSDQVWNSEAKEITGKYFADFAAKEKRASYAASFGIDQIIPERQAEFKEYLLGMKYISVRESIGVDIVKKLTGSDAYCHVDPTLLLNSENWNKLVDPSFEKNDKYGLCYFLGVPSTEVLNTVKSYCKDRNIKIKTICSGESSDDSNVGPDGFIALIKNAEFVITDSFHGTVFSIIYERPFYTFTRVGVKSGMASRVASILNLLGLQDRFDPKNFSMESIADVDFTEAKKILEYKRKDAFDYLELVTKIK